MWLVENCPNDIHMQGKAADYIMRLGSRMGMSPSDRVGLKAEKIADSKDKFLRVV